MSVAALPMLVRAMHREMAEFAKDAIEKYPVEERNFTGITMGINEESLIRVMYGSFIIACKTTVVVSVPFL